MSNRGESVILPSNAVFLVHKVGRGSQWETRTKAMRAAPDPTPRVSVASSGEKSVKAKRNAIEGGSWEFVTYAPRKGQQQLPRRTKETKRKRRVEGASPKDRPAKRDWFPKMMEDETWRCIILSLSASYLASMTGSSTNYVDSHSLLGEALQQLNSRIASGAPPSEQTLGAIACLAMWSNDQGNHDKAWIHARGLAELVKLRGGFFTISDRMRSKVYRGVFDVAVDVDRPPLLDDGLRDSPGRECTSGGSLDLEASEPGPSPCRVPPRLSRIFCDVAQLGATVDDAIARNVKLDPNDLYQTVFGLYNRLLTCKFDGDDSLRICLILYVKSIACNDRLSLTSTNLVRKLQASVQGCLRSSSTPLTRWKLFIGGMAASSGSVEQHWFLQRLAASVAKTNMVGEDGWTALRAELSSILWTKPVNEDVGYKLWLQITATDSTR
ncbi:hypothetical protein Trco_006225 [Trichoderma cornu-damae]|uniref:Uncharacterized protein n=1 Tax=Trichoderma cornu-damae TaxID=654480 RepID=A0A9P8QK59_9HYPO|nr:hypothetical protein Trco_006225 [Trichoderma cornu-damae]